LAVHLPTEPRLVYSPPEIGRIAAQLWGILLQMKPFAFKIGLLPVFH